MAAISTTTSILLLTKSIHRYIFMSKRIKVLKEVAIVVNKIRQMKSDLQTNKSQTYDKHV